MSQTWITIHATTTASDTRATPDARDEHRGSVETPRERGRRAVTNPREQIALELGRLEARLAELDGQRTAIRERLVT
jgi:hypothetical protein